MPFIPHTQKDEQQMLDLLGVSNIDELFREIPSKLVSPELNHISPGMSEMELTRWVRERFYQKPVLNFIGAGAYEHHIPAAVWEIAGRGEWMTAYTPYQAEASQGSLQLIYEYQSMMTRLLSMDVSNASLYDGATALAEAVLMSVRLSKKNQARTVLVPNNLHPHYRQVLKTITGQQNIHCQEIKFNDKGQVDQNDLIQKITPDVAAVIIPQPNFFGVIEDVHALTRIAKERSLLTIAVVNPIAMALLTPPGEWDDSGVDIACGEGQPLGIPLSFGGPYFGFLTCKKEHIRQLPGRLVGRTQDLEGKNGFVLTLQAREQHIRRGKATSNICTNQGLMVTAASIYLSLLGGSGLSRVASTCRQRAYECFDLLKNISGMSPHFVSPFFHEQTWKFDQDLPPILRRLQSMGIQAGIHLGDNDAQLKNVLLICVTETKTTEDFQQLANALKHILQENT